ncbi:hypothetical protein ASPBRDRAFT_619033 [Aspergillus brasiliensis CBS 101740]|uniref:Uncharacterized protein n=1 Tax=Aspergillus brasiliensis (strain CBS 101740 / IMI 381727 / IBT 21946) TaxID=767769 RepID=A0A1L9UFE9_ASPBC|nr:hypothetical protein ASPBRDRAFT_619033 [Aspergillus brasiliensis CBS 101740]
MCWLAIVHKNSPLTMSVTGRFTSRSGHQHRPNDCRICEFMGLDGEDASLHLTSPQWSFCFRPRKLSDAAIEKIGHDNNRGGPGVERLCWQIYHRTSRSNETAAQNQQHKWWWRKLFKLGSSCRPNEENGFKLREDRAVTQATIAAFSLRGNLTR